MLVPDPSRRATIPDIEHDAWFRVYESRLHLSIPENDPLRFLW
jgi:hypothetical protein